MPKKKTKALKTLARNSYIGRIKGTLPAYEPGRCTDLTLAERKKIEHIHHAIFHLLDTMANRD